MKNLFKLTDVKIILVITLLFITFLITLSIYLPKPVEQNNTKNFTGIDAAGFKHGEGQTTTIINH